MKFCDVCGSYMEMTAGGYSCPRCGNRVEAGAVEVWRTRGSQPGGVHVVDGSIDRSLLVNRICPRCGYPKALRRISMISGEHAGVKKERTSEQYKCARCFHTWTHG
ncbi:MAG: hypothetical protein ACE5OO_08705 [Candidatus Bathyarchaeia archaeon]